MNFSHAGNLGDVIYSLPTLAAISKKSNGDINLLLKTGVEGAYYLGAYHPCGPYRMTEDAAKFMLPLLNVQPYLKRAYILSENDKIDYQLDSFRDLTVDLSRGCLARWYFSTFSVACDLSQPWLIIPKSEQPEGRVIVNRTLRYRNLGINYAFLSQFPPIYFVGLEEEYIVCRKEIPKLEWIETKDALELAQVIASARLFIANQSFPFAIAEALKIPRILEVCPWAPNVVPHGNQAWDVYFQKMFEIIANDIISKEFYYS